MCGSYRNEIEKANLLYWQVTCESFYTPDEWKWFFKKQIIKVITHLFILNNEKNKKIKAAVLEKNFRPLVIKNIYLKDQLEKNQIFIKIFYTGICGSQIGEINAVGVKIDTCLIYLVMKQLVK